MGNRNLLWLEKREGLIRGFRDMGYVGKNLIGCRIFKDELYI